MKNVVSLFGGWLIRQQTDAVAQNPLPAACWRSLRRRLTAGWSPQGNCWTPVLRGKGSRIAWSLALLCGALAGHARGQVTAFTYQGRLDAGTNLAQGAYDFRFALFDASTGGNLLIPGAVTNSGTVITNGIFTVTLDFGREVFDGGARWLELAVRPTGGTNFETLAPRQPITATPYANFTAVAGSATTAVVAGSANSVPAGGITGVLGLSQLPAGLITNGAAAINLSGNFTGNGIGITNISLHALNTEGALAWNTYGVTFASSNIPVGNTPHHVTAADVNGDGRLDLVCANTSDNNLWVLTNRGGGAFGLAATCPTGASPNWVTVADVNRDGRLDLVTANQDANTLTVLTNNGLGNFSLAVSVPVGSVPRAVVAADVNGDGWPDLISANSGNSTLTVLTNNGRGGFVVALNLPTGSQPYGVVVGDFNGDGQLDLVSADFAANSLTLFTNAGQARFAVAAALAVGRGPYAVAAADVDRNGQLDLVSADALGGTLTILTNSGSGFAVAATLEVGEAPVSVAAADLNRDQWVDLVCANAYAQAVTLFTNDGSGGFVLAGTNQVGATPWMVTTADVDGDGKLDVLAANAGQNSITLLLNTQLPDQLVLKADGSQLFNLNPARLSAGTATISITGNANTATLSSNVAVGAVGTAQLAAGAVTAEKIDDGGSAAYQYFLSTAQGLHSGAALPFAALGVVGASGGGSATLTFSINGAAFGSVVGFTVSEGLSQLYTNYVQVRSTGSALDPASQIGAKARLLVNHNGQITAFGGLITTCAAGIDRNGVQLYTFRLESVLATLAYSSDYRLYQNETSCDTAELILQAAGITAFESRLTETYPSRLVSIQYGESHLNFFSRLLEREGIYYFFDHGATLPTLILADGISAHGQESVPSVNYYGDSATSLPASGEYVRNFHKAIHQSSHQTTVHSYNFTKSYVNNPQTCTSASGVGVGQQYEFGDSQREVVENATRAALLQGQQACQRALISGASTAPDLRAGSLFNLTDQSGAGLSGQYLVTEVRHSGFLRITNGASTFYYGNQFQTIPATLTYRPPQATPKPQAQPCTATVVGKAGEEIWTDVYGRIKVQFHWDRYGNKDEYSSPWLRVSSPMAGDQTRGMVFLPRIGDEVLVSFIMGDPDQPVVTGSLFNDNNVPPVQLPANATMSCIRSRASKGNGPGNELRFEDKAGSEMLSLLAPNVMNLSAVKSITLSSQTTTVEGTFNNNSDRAAKERFTPIAPGDILQKLAQLPITEWSYRADAETRHLGPMAQDFYAAFQVGSDERHIAPIDEGGIALAAIQGLNDKVEARSRQLEAENLALRARLEQLEKLFHNLAEKSAPPSTSTPTENKTCPRLD